METLSTDGPGCDLARKKKRKDLSRLLPTSVTTKFLPSRPRRAVASPIHLQSPSRSTLAVSLMCALGSCMRDFTPTRIASSDSDPTVPSVRRLGVSSGTVRRLLKASSRHPAEEERARLLTSCPPLHHPPSLPTSKQESCFFRRYHSSTQSLRSLPSPSLILLAHLIQSFLVLKLTDAVGTKVPALDGPRAVLF